MLRTALASCFLSLATLPALATAPSDQSPLAFWGANAPKNAARFSGTVGVPLDILPKPKGYVRGRLTCAVNVHRALAQRGVKGTGSALAKSYTTWGAPSRRPVPGGVAVYHRGRSSTSGHVAVVASASGMCWNPSARRQDWQLVPCQQGRFIGYRAPA